MRVNSLRRLAPRNNRQITDAKSITIKIVFRIESTAVFSILKMSRCDSRLLKFNMYACAYVLVITSWYLLETLYFDKVVINHKDVYCDKCAISIFIWQKFNCTLLQLFNKNYVVLIRNASRLTIDYMYIMVNFKFRILL